MFSLSKPSGISIIIHSSAYHSAPAGLQEISKRFSNSFLIVSYNFFNNTVKYFLKGPVAVNHPFEFPLFSNVSNLYRYFEIAYSEAVYNATAKITDDPPAV